MTELFQPVGEQSMWQTFYDCVKDIEIGILLTYSKLKAMTGFDVQTNRSLIYRANRQLLENHKKMLINVRTEGYKMGRHPEQITHASFRRIRAKRQLDKGVIELVFCDTNKMSNEEKERHTHLVNHYQSSLKVIRKRNIEAIKQTEKAVKAQISGLNELDNVKLQLEAIEKKLKS